MNTTAVGMSIFGLLIVGGLVLAVRQGQKQREQVARYSESRGYPVLTETESRLGELLSEALPDATWSVQRLMLVDRASPRSYLFGLETRPKEGRSTSSNSTGFLAEHRIGRIDSPVVIFSRTPGLDVMLGDASEVGVQDFRKRYTVTCASARTATEVVNLEIQQILLEHWNGPGWYLTVTITGGAVLVSSYWAQSEEEWDYLVELGRRLRDHVR